jgi:hypothetical protein
MNYKVNILNIVVVTAFASTTLAADFCPIPSSRVAISLNSKVTYDKNSGLYTYNYDAAVLKSSPLDLAFIKLFFNESRVLNAKTTQDWGFSGHGSPYEDADVSFAAGWPTLKPGEKISGLSFQSKLPPGLVKYSPSGATGVPVTTPTADHDEPTPDCPGFYPDEKFIDSYALGVIAGPSDPGYLYGNMRYINRGHRHHDDKNPPRFDISSKGQIKLALKGDKDLNVEQIDLASLSLGYGKAKPVSTKIVKRMGEDKDCDDMKESKKERHDSQSPELIMTFNLEDIGIRCDRDLALILDGSVTAGATNKKLMAYVPMKPVACTPAIEKSQRDFYRKHPRNKADKRSEEMRRELMKGEPGE